MNDPTETETTPMATYQQRVVNEKAELDVKLGRLNTFLATLTFAELGPAERDRLQRQVLAMKDYSTILGERIAAFS